MKYEKQHKSGDVITLPDAVGATDLKNCNKHAIYASGDVTVTYRIGERNWAQHTLTPPAEAVNGYADNPQWNQTGVCEIEITCNADTNIRVDSTVNGGR